MPTSGHERPTPTPSGFEVRLQTQPQSPIEGMNQALHDEATGERARERARVAERMNAHMGHGVEVLTPGD